MTRVRILSREQIRGLVLVRRSVLLRIDCMRKEDQEDNEEVSSMTIRVI
jgi:hypothetical protein